MEFFNKGSQYHRSKWLLKETPSPSFQNLVKATLAHRLQGVDKCVWGHWANSLKGKNSLAKLLTSGRPFNPTTLAAQTHSTRHRHTDTDTQTQTGSQHLTSTWDRDRHSTNVSPQLPWGLGLQEQQEGVQGETGTPPREAKEEGAG